MSDHALPPNSSSWPRDPYQLLGVDRSISPRDLRRVYLRLIRSYKPEHAPEEFRRIREAYETVLRFAEHFAIGTPPVELNDDSRVSSKEIEHGDDSAPSSANLEEEPIPTGRRADPIDHQSPWEIACGGDGPSAYRALCDRALSGRSREETYLQLYWLLVTDPKLDPDRDPCSVLVEGIRACGRSAGALVEILRLDAGADPGLAVGRRLVPLLTRGAPVDLIAEIIGVRWRVALKLWRWEVIIEDVRTLREWVATEDHMIWGHVLIAAATHLVWAEGVGMKFIDEEIQALGRNSLNLSDPLFLLDHARELDKGLSRLGRRNDFTAEFRRLLAFSWNGLDQEVLHLLRIHISHVAKNPQFSLEILDIVQSLAPLVLSRLAIVLDASGLDDDPDFRNESASGVRSTVDGFLSTNRWWHYEAFRPRLLDFSQREMISPAAFVRVTKDRPEYTIPDQKHLAQKVADDAPLSHVYRACEIYHR